MPGGAAATTPLRERSRQLSSEMTGSVEDRFTQVSIQLGLAVHAALEAVRENKSLRMAGYWWQWLEDTWVRYNAAYTLYASKLKEASLEVEAYWVRGRKDYEGAREPLEEYIMALQVKPEVNEVAPEVSAVDEVNEVAPEVSAVDEVNEVALEVSAVNKVNEESAMNEDSGEVCDAKEEMRKGKPPEVLQRFGLAAKVQVEEFGMKEVKNLEDVEKVENGLPPSKEVKGIEDLMMKTKEESRHASWDPGELVDAEAQMSNVKEEEILVSNDKVELTLNKKEARPRGDVNANVLSDAMLLFNFMQLYISEVLVPVARNAARFVDVNPLSSRCFAESFLPTLSDYG